MTIGKGGVAIALGIGLLFLAIPIAESGDDKNGVTLESAPAERHLKNIRQLTVGRQNAEAYFSFDGTQLIFQSTNKWTTDTYADALTPADTPLGLLSNVRDGPG